MEEDRRRTTTDAATRVEQRHSEDRVLDTGALRALAHPLRVQIYDILSQYGPQTASSLAERLGESTGSTSYHLRALAKHDLIREVTDRGTGRERWWERPVGGVSFANPDAMKTPAGRAATQIVMNEFLRNRNEQLMDFVNRGHRRRGRDVAGRHADLHRHRASHPRAEQRARSQDHGADRRRRGQLPQSDRRERATRHHPGRRLPASRTRRTVMTAITAPRTATRRDSVRAHAAARGIRSRRIRRRSRSSGAAAPSTAAPPRRSPPSSPSRRRRGARRDRHASAMTDAIDTDAAGDVADVTQRPPRRRPGGHAGARSAATSANCGRPPRSATSPTASAAPPFRSSRRR